MAPSIVTTPPSIMVREYSGLLDDLDSNAGNGSSSSEEKEETPPETPPEKPEPSPPPPAKEQPPLAEEKPPSAENEPPPTEEEEESPAMPAAAGGKAADGNSLKLTLELEVDAANLSGDLGKYAGTSWKLTSPSVEGGVFPLQTPAPSEATVSTVPCMRF